MPVLRDARDRDAFKINFLRDSFAKQHRQQVGLARERRRIRANETIAALRDDGPAALRQR